MWLLAKKLLALRVGLEPTTYRLTAGCSTIELPKIISLFINSFFQKIDLLPGNFLLSQVVTNQVPSALRGLTSVFGMGTGVSLLLLSPYLFTFTSQSITVYISSQVFDLLVSVSFDITIFTPLTYLSCFLQVIS